MDSEPLSSAERTRLSKMLALILRHKPETVDIELDERGAVDLDELADAIAEQAGWEFIEVDHIRSVVDGGPRRRFEIDLDNNTIRARYGHSLAVKVEYEPSEPPDVLYHGCAPESAREILEEGLSPMGRQYVHLSVSPRVAFEVGSRHSDHPATISIDAAAAAADGIEFYHATEEIWLAEELPVKYLSRLGPTRPRSR